jgi:hypothetical protein
VIDFVTGASVTGAMDVEWIHGAPGEPAIQVHRYDDHTVILRQGKSVHWEAPFLFLWYRGTWTRCGRSSGSVTTGRTRPSGSI